ncbi:putative hydrolase of the HAD superfamily [Rossellomorea marisflavi]
MNHFKGAELYIDNVESWEVDTMIKAVCFDLDNTLLDRDRSLHSFLVDQYARLNMFHHVKKDLFMNRFIELDDRGYVWKDSVYETLIREFYMDGHTVEGLLSDYLLHFQNHCIPLGPVEEVLGELRAKGMLIAIISNGYHQFQSDNLRALSIHLYAHTILISESEGMRKPDKRIFQSIAGKMGVQVEECVFVGDHPINDVKGAKDAGMTSIWLRSEGYSVPDHADAIIDQLQELLSVLSEMEQ